MRSCCLVDDLLDKITKQIERANISDLDWAFAYMGSGGSGSSARRPKAKPERVKWVYEEEAKTGKEYVSGSLSQTTPSVRSLTVLADRTSCVVSVPCCSMMVRGPDCDITSW